MQILQSCLFTCLIFDRVCRKERQETDDTEKISPAASKDSQTGAKSNNYGDTGEDGYMDIDSLDKPKENPQDTELDNVSMDGPYSTVKVPAMNGQVQKEVTSDDIVMVENDGYEGVGGDRADDVVMVTNDNYEEFGEGDGATDGMVMVDNAGYEGFTPKGNGNGDELVMVENGNYEGMPPGNDEADDIVMEENDNYEGIKSG